jgi:hypothetical protein
VTWLRAMSATWRAAEASAEKADLLHAIYDRDRRRREEDRVRQADSVGVRPRIRALALPEQVAVARPTGLNRADAINIRVPIEGADANLVAEGA